MIAVSFDVSCQIAYSARVRHLGYCQVWYEFDKTLESFPSGPSSNETAKVRELDRFGPCLSTLPEPGNSKPGQQCALDIEQYRASDGYGFLRIFHEEGFGGSWVSPAGPRWPEFVPSSRVRY